MHEWFCHHDLMGFWSDKCLLGVCDEPELDELHKLFLGNCVMLGETSVCPGKVKDIADIAHDGLGQDERIFGDRIWGLSGLSRQFRGSRCLKIGLTFVCDDDIHDILATGCADIHSHDSSGHKNYKVCDGELADLLEGTHVTMHDVHILKAKFSSDFTDLGDMCRHTGGNHQVCWSDIDDLFKPDEECTLYGETWLCYLQIQHAWQHGECLKIDNHALCDEDFYKVAQRHCVTLEEIEFCPRAFGVRSSHKEFYNEHLSEEQYRQY